jgi:hypothetical protein
MAKALIVSASKAIGMSNILKQGFFDGRSVPRAFLQKNPVISQRYLTKIQG